MAAYRPLGLSSAPNSTIIAGRATSYADRRRAAAERLSKTADLARRIEAAAESAAPDVAADAPIDPQGTLRDAVRALLPLAQRTDEFDITISLGPANHWAARIRRDGDGVSADLVPGPAAGRVRARVPSARADGRATAGPGPSGSSPDDVAAELAALIWSGGVGSR